MPRRPMSSRGSCRHVTAAGTHASTEANGLVTGSQRHQRSAWPAANRLHRDLLAEDRASPAQNRRTRPAVAGHRAIAQRTERRVISAGSAATSNTCLVRDSICCAGLRQYRRKAQLQRIAARQVRHFQPARKVTASSSLSACWRLTRDDAPIDRHHRFHQSTDARNRAHQQKASSRDQSRRRAIRQHKGEGVAIYRVLTATPSCAGARRAEAVAPRRTKCSCVARWRSRWRRPHQPPAVRYRSAGAWPAAGGASARLHGETPNSSEKCGADDGGYADAVRDLSEINVVRNTVLDQARCGAPASRSPRSPRTPVPVPDGTSGRAGPAASAAAARTG